MKTKKINKSILNKKHIEDIILGSLLTEKSTKYEMELNTISFIVPKNISKSEIKNGLSKLFDTKVLKVRTATTQKKTRYNRKNGAKIFGKVIKKAYVRFAEINKVVAFLYKSGEALFAQNEMPSKIDPKEKEATTKKTDAKVKKTGAAKKDAKGEKNEK